MKGYIAIHADDCIICGICIDMCPATPCVFQMGEAAAVIVAPEACEECMLCFENCPTGAVHIAERPQDIAELSGS